MGHAQATSIHSASRACLVYESGTSGGLTRIHYRKVPRADPVTSATLFVKTRHVCFRHNAQLNDIKPRDGRGQRHAFRLEVRRTDVFPAKEPGIDGPSSRSHHRQTHALC